MTVEKVSLSLDAELVAKARRVAGTVGGRLWSTTPSVPSCTTSGSVAGSPRWTPSSTPSRRRSWRPLELRDVASDVARLLLELSPYHLAVETRGQPRVVRTLRVIPPTKFLEVRGGRGSARLRQ